MIIIKNKPSIRKMEEAGKLLTDIFDDLSTMMHPGISTAAIDSWIVAALSKSGLVSRTKGYKGYSHASCISLNDEVVHGVPSQTRILRSGDIVKVDVCASYKDYCADMARTFLIGDVSEKACLLTRVVQMALDKGIAQAQAGNHVSDISAAIQEEVERHGFSVIRDFAGHGIGKHMHEEPEILNYGNPGKGQELLPGMTFALEPMITMGGHEVYIAEDGWTVKTADKSLAAHAEDTVLVTEQGPKVLTRKITLG